MNCCLCKEAVSATDHRKKKRLQGPGCVSVRELLQDLAEVQLFCVLSMRRSSRE